MGSLPDRRGLDPDRVTAILREIGVAVPVGRPWIAAVTALCASVAEVPRQPVPTWAVADHQVRRRPSDAALVCSCGGTGCTHSASVQVVLALSDPARRRVLSAAPWELALAPLAQGPAPAPPRHLGQIRYEVRPPTPGIRALILDVHVVRHATGGRSLEPMRYPRTADALSAAVTGITPADLELHPAWHALERARRLEKNKQGHATRHLSRGLLGPLSRVPEVWYGGVTVTVQPDPLRPRLTATRGDDGSLALAWHPALAVHWRHAGIVLTRDGVLAPLADSLPDATADRLMDPLPPIPPADVQVFVDRLVVARGLDVVLPADLPTIHPPDARAARITLAERSGHRLEVILEVVYDRRQGQAVIRPTPWSPTALVPDEGLVRRDRDWEVATIAAFSEAIGHPEGIVLPFAEAMAFLEDRLPALAEDWEIFGQGGLSRLKVAGTLQPRLNFREGEDWFDLDVVFEVGGNQIPGAAVLAGWLQGSRYHRLDDQTLARLPTRWLDRHGARVDALIEVRRAQRRLGSWHAWMASDLLAEVGDPAAAWLGWVHRLQRDGGVPAVVPHPALKATLRPYQREGVSWLTFLANHGLHGVLADEMGLGKTVQTLAVLLAAHRGDAPAAHPSLVVAPTSVIWGWHDEATKFAPSLKVVLWHGADRSPEDLDGADIVVTTYALLRRDLNRLGTRRWTWAVLDEAHHIKNPGSQTARAARRIQARHRLALTGTPLQNDLTELWSLFGFLMPGYLGRRGAFHARYTVTSPEALADLSHRIRPFLLRRRKVDVATELPARTEITVRVPLSDRERTLYDSIRLTVLTASQAADDDPNKRRDLVLTGLTRLRQACCHPGLLPFPEARRIVRSAKVDALVSHLQRGIAAGSRALVFSQWVQLLDRVSARLDAAQIDHVRLQGDTRDRAQVIARFQDPDGPPVFLISIQAGGTGLNLTAADVVYLLDPWWNPAVERQATDRAHRIGQPKPVTVVRLVAADTIEERILELQADKQRLFDETVERTPLQVSRLSLDDLRSLLG